MKKPKISSGSGTPQSESNSLTHSPSHSLPESDPPPPNDEFEDLTPPDTLNTLRVEAEEVEGEVEEERELNEGDEEADVDEDEDDADEDEDEDEEEDEDEDEDEEVEDEAEERDGDDDSFEGGDEEGKTTSEERKKLDDGFFEVEAIRKKRICKGVAQYFIKWRGWPESANTWEPVDHLQTCPDVVEAYEESLRAGQKKSSRKRKRKFTQPKKKMQYSYGVSKKHDEAVRRPRKAKSMDYKGSETVSPLVASNEKERSDQCFGQSSSGKHMKIHFPLPTTIEGDGPANFQTNASCVEVGQSKQRRGAKRRKSGSVRRFTQDTSSLNYDYFGNTAPGNISTREFDSSPVITSLVNAITFSASVTNNVQDVTVQFAAMRSDGREVLVDNKFLKANYPQLLINFYEQHLRYNPN